MKDKVRFVSLHRRVIASVNSEYVVFIVISVSLWECGENDCLGVCVSARL